MSIEPYTLSDFFKEYHFSGEFEGLIGKVPMRFAVENYQPETGLFIASGLVKSDPSLGFPNQELLTSFYGQIAPGDERSAIVMMQHYFTPDSRFPTMHHTGILTKHSDMITLNTSYEGTNGIRYCLDLKVSGERKYPLARMGWLERAMQLQLP